MSNKMTLSGSVPSHGTFRITLPDHALPLNNSGDEIFLVNPSGKLRHQVSYSAQDVVQGLEVHFLIVDAR